MKTFFLPFIPIFLLAKFNGRPLRNSNNHNEISSPDKSFDLNVINSPENFKTLPAFAPPPERLFSLKWRQIKDSPLRGHVVVRWSRISAIHRLRLENLPPERKKEKHRSPARDLLDSRNPAGFFLRRWNSRAGGRSL